jgi:hypothetical protein
VGIKDYATNAYITENDAVGPANNLFHSLFSQVDVAINDQLICPSTHTYAYKAYLENLCNYGSDAVHSTLGCILHNKDAAGHMDSLVKTEAGKVSTCDNPGLLERRSHFIKGRAAELIGKPLFSLSCQPKFLPGNTKVKFTFTRNKDSFCLMYNPGNGNHRYKLVVEEAILYIRKSIIDPATIIAHQKVLGSGETAKFLTRSGVVRKYAIASGLSNHTIDNLGAQGRLPSKLYIWMVKTSAASGNSSQNPFNFEHFNLNFLASYVDGTQFPLREFRPDFELGKYLREYYHTLTASNCSFNNDAGLAITREDYPNGYSLFAVEFAPHSSSDETFEIQKRGSLRVELQFKEALKQPTTLFMYMEYESMIEIALDNSVKFAPLV